jgi:hypothetical protein
MIPTRNPLPSRIQSILLAGGISCCLLIPSSWSQSPAPAAMPVQVAKASPGGAPTTYEPNHFPKREHSYFNLFWGVDSLSAKSVESGELIKFTYRVLDAAKAKALNDKNNEPVMYDPAIRAKLVVPSLEKVGQLRQASTPEAGKIYWMAFSNPGRVVKRGDRVTVVIGQFHIEGLVVE